MGQFDHGMLDDRPTGRAAVHREVSMEFDIDDLHQVMGFLIELAKLVRSSRRRVVVIVRAAD